MRRINILIIIISVLCLLVGCSSKIKITYDLGYDSITNTEEVDKGLLPKAESPIREGYEFLGWYDANDKEFDFLKEVEEDITLYAKWEAKEKMYTVNFETNGGEKIDPIQSSKDIPTITPKKEGYYFTGWYVDKNLKNYLLKDFTLSSDITLYASWSKVVSVPDLKIDAFRDEMSIHTDITYKVVNGKALKLDIYMPALEEGKKSPVLFIYYGGGWITGDKSELYFNDSYIYELVGKGMTVIVPNYRLCSATVSYPSPVIDCLDAIRFAVKWQDELRIDVNNMGSYGYSAGGHLALMAGYAQNHFKGDPALSEYEFKLKYVVDLFGPAHYDVSFISSLTIVTTPMITSYIGVAGANGIIDYSEAFPSYYLEENNPSVFIVHGDHDSLVPFAQSEVLYDMLLKKNYKVTFTKVVGAQHVLNPASGFDSVSPSIEEIFSNIVSFILKEVNLEN